MKKINKGFRKLKEIFTMVSITAIQVLVLTESKIFGASNTQSIDSFINFACEWLTKIRRSNCVGWGSDVRTAVGKGKMLREKAVVS